MIIDHVEDHLDAGGVQRLHHVFELAHVRLWVARGGVFGMRRKEGGGVVAPVIRQTALLEEQIVEMRVHRQKLHRGDAELSQVIGHHRLRETCVGAAQLRGHLGMRFREAAHVQLINHGVTPTRPRRRIVAPVVVSVHDDGFEGLRAVVARVSVQHVRGRIHRTADGEGVGIEEQFFRVKTQTVALGAVAVKRAGARAGHGDVPEAIFRAQHACSAFFARAIKEAKIDRRGMT